MQSASVAAPAGALIAIGAAPQPTYVCGDGLIRSAVFGALPADTGIEGEYFRPEYVRWIQIADSAPSGHEREALVNALSAELEAALATALGDDTSTKARAAEFLPFFFDGTFGLCVADPSSGAGIAKKELLQERLVALTGNGSRIAETDDENRQLLALIDDRDLRAAAQAARLSSARATKQNSTCRCEQCAGHAPCYPHRHARHAAAVAL